MPRGKNHGLCVGDKDRRARTGAWEVIILLSPVLVVLESSAQLLAVVKQHRRDRGTDQ